jgi:O-antigen ligase
MFKIKPLLGVVVLVFGLIHLLPDEQKERFSSSGDDKTSVQRLLYWKNGWEMMKEHPLTGVGLYSFIPYYNRYYSGDVLFTDRGAELPHNIFIQVGTDAGFPALIFFVLLILYCMRTCYRLAHSPVSCPLTKSIAAGLGMGVLGYLIAGQFVTVAYYPFLWVHLSFIVSIASIYNSTVKTQRFEWGR